MKSLLKLFAAFAADVSSAGTWKWTQPGCDGNVQKSEWNPTPEVSAVPV